MIGSAANSGQAMLAGLRVGAPAKAAGDAVAGAFDAVVAGLGVAADAGAGSGEVVPVVPAAPVGMDTPIDPVAAADVLQELVASPAPASTYAALPMVTPALETAAVVADGQATTPAPLVPQIAPALVTPAIESTPTLPAGIEADPVVVGATPVPVSVASALPPEVTVAAPVAPSSAEALGTPGSPTPPVPVRVAPDEAVVAANAGDGGEDVSGDGETVTDTTVAHPAANPAPTIVYAPWLAPVSRPAVAQFADSASGASPSAPPVPDVVTVLPQSAPTIAPGSPPFVQADLSPAARPFVVADLFAPSGDVASAGRAESDAVDLSAVPVAAPVRFTPLVPAASPGFTPLVAVADSPVDDALVPADGVIIADDQTTAIVAPPTDQTADVAAPLVTTAQPLPTAQPTAPPISGPDVAQVVAGHQLDLARDSEWLDQLARDIVAAGASDAKLSFKLNPEHLGSLHVEILRGDDGASVRLTTENEGARAALADAQGRLVAEARAHGMKIAETHVDLGNQGSGHGQRGGADGQSGQPYTPPQPARVNAPVTMIALDDDMADARTGPRERYA